MMVNSTSTAPPPADPLDPVQRFFLTYVESLGVRIRFIGPDYILAIVDGENIKFMLGGDGITSLALSGPHAGKSVNVMTWAEMRRCMAMQAN
jgi:hypothetical protein